ncbi:MAG: SlyX family protein [Methylococcales bacterium]|nr:SlyX family protein [Methylococcales bacterium]
MSETRIIELEIKVAYQEDLLHSLNDIISDQQKQLYRLENSLTLLHQRQQTLADNMESTSSDDNQPPPHY